MKCPICGKSRFKVVDTRQQEKNAEICIIRERRCLKCGHREEWNERKNKVLKTLSRA